MIREPTKNCRVFISRKKSDSGVSQKIRGTLEKMAPNLEFFDDGDIEPGAKWRERLGEELSKANLLLLVVTKPAMDDFDWMLYETGLFESTDKEDPRKVICIHPDPEYTKTRIRIPSQLGDKQLVKADKNEILRLLISLFHDQHFTQTLEPLNDRLTEDDLRPLAGTIADAINRVESERIRSWAYTNYYIQLRLPPKVESLEAEVEVESDEGTLRKLFDLAKMAASSGVGNKSPERSRRKTIRPDSTCSGSNSSGRRSPQ